MVRHNFSTIGHATAAASRGTNRVNWNLIGINDVLAQYHGRQSGLPYELVGGIPILPRTPRVYQLVIKRIMDIVLVLSALIVLAPMFVGVALAIKLTSRGPVLFHQTRVGYRGHPFTIFKFRTMYTDLCDVSGIEQTRNDDRRVTPVGRILRKTSIDELPQLLNVLRGEMSLVGPRPHVAGMLAGGQVYEDLVPYYALRHEMLPGLTGWAQANGLRGPTLDPVTAIKRVDHDIAYIQNFSVLLDLKIMLLTLWREFLSGDAV